MDSLLCYFTNCASDHVNEISDKNHGFSHLVRVISKLNVRSLVFTVQEERCFENIFTKDE